MRVGNQGLASLLIVLFSTLGCGKDSQDQSAYQILTMDHLQEAAPKFFGDLQRQLTVTKSNDFVPVRFQESGEYAALTNSIVVKLLPGFGAEVFDSAFNQSLETISGLERTYVLHFDTVDTAMNALAHLSELDSVDYIENDFQMDLNTRSISAEPSDEFFKDQWHLKNTGQLGADQNVDMQILEAWKTTTGKKTRPIVAVIDGGFDVDHLDLKDNWYVNAGEIPDNDIDDDENGLVDDHIGWNFALDSNNLPYGFRSDHGTAVAGLVSAPINGIGTVGTCPDCRVLPITINGRGSSDAKGFLYALEQGAAIITNSWGYSIGTQRTKLVEEAIAKAAKEGRDGKGAIIFFAMNNRNVDDCTTFNPDISAHPDVIAVSAMDGTGTRVRKSAYGSCLKFLSLTAQSYREDGIVTTDRPGSKGYNKYENDEDELSNLDYTRQFGGTSAATPILAGGAALLLDLNPDLSKDELIEILASTARKVNADIANYDEETGHSESHGFGLVSIDAAVKSVLARQQAQ